MGKRRENRTLYLSFSFGTHSPEGGKGRRRNYTTEKDTRELSCPCGSGGGNALSLNGRAVQIGKKEMSTRGEQGRREMKRGEKGGNLYTDERVVILTRGRGGIGE